MLTLSPSIFSILPLEKPASFSYNGIFHLFFYIKCRSSGGQTVFLQYVKISNQKALRHALERTAYSNGLVTREYFTHASVYHTINLNQPQKINVILFKSCGIIIGFVCELYKMQTNNDFNCIPHKIPLVF